MRNEIRLENFKKIFLLLGIFLLLNSCESKTEIIRSKVYPSVFLIKNPPQNDSLVANILQNFLQKIPKKNHDKSKVFYKYTSDTKYFINNKEDLGGFSSEELSKYDNDAKIATFFISKCKNDTLKKLGTLSFYNKPIESDIIIFNCN